MLGGSAALALATAAMLVGLFTSGGLEQDPLGLVGPGPLVSWSAPVVNLLLDLAVIGCLGALLSVLFLLRTDGGPLGVQRQRAVRDARQAAAVWALAALAGAPLAGATGLGVSFTLLWGRLGAALELPEVQGLLLSAVLAGLIAGTAGRMRTSATTMTAGILGVAALLPLLLTAFPRDESGAVPATLALIVHVVGATAWIGGLAGVVRYGRGNRVGLPIVLARFGRIAWISAVAVLVSGLLTAGLRRGAQDRTSALDGLVSGGYGGLLLAKVVAFVLLILGGWWHRSHLVVTQRDADTTFWRIVAVELFILAAAVGLSVALAHTP